jgi:hypothetical protein
MACAPQPNLEATLVRELNQLHDILNRAGLEHSEGQPTHDVSKVVRSRLPRRIVKEECSTEVR